MVHIFYNDKSNRALAQEMRCALVGAWCLLSPYVSSEKRAALHIWRETISCACLGQFNLTHHLFCLMSGEHGLGVSVGTLDRRHSSHSRVLRSCRFLEHMLADLHHMPSISNTLKLQKQLYKASHSKKMHVCLFSSIHLQQPLYYGQGGSRARQ